MGTLQHCLRFFPLSLIKLCAEYSQFLDLEGVATVFFKLEFHRVFNVKTGDSFLLSTDMMLMSLKMMDHFFLRRGSFAGILSEVNLDYGFAISVFSYLYLRTEKGWIVQPYSHCYAGGLCNNQLSFLYKHGRSNILKVGDKCHNVENASTDAQFWRNQTIYGQMFGTVCSYSPERGTTVLAAFSCDRWCRLDCEARSIRKLFVLSPSSWLGFSGHWIAYYKNNRIVWQFPFSSELDKLTNCVQMWETIDGLFLCRLYSGTCISLTGAFTNYSEVVILQKESDKLTLKKWRINVDFILQLGDDSVIVFQNNTKTHHRILSY